MYAVIVTLGGRQIEALLLSATPNRLRVLFPGSKDTAEFRLIEGRWISETEGQMEFGAMIMQDAEHLERVIAASRPRTFAAC